MKRKHWYDYLWILTPIYLGLGFFNILFAWLGMIFFILPLFFAIFKGNKQYCNRYCDRGQFLQKVADCFHFSMNKPAPKWMRTKIFRYGFLIFFFTMFAQMLYVTYLVGSGAIGLQPFIKLFWTFKFPWNWISYGSVFPLWFIQFAFGFYSMMLTSTLIGLMVMILYKPRTWCVFCPMGTTTQLICRAKVNTCHNCNRHGDKRVEVR